jgi:phosphoglycerol transferase MdoB-like AlkP superfamily enzyme
MENECFGLPNGGMIVGIVIGIIIIIAGISLFLQTTYGISINYWPIILIIFGILILAGGLYRQKRYKERHANAP